MIASDDIRPCWDCLLLLWTGTGLKILSFEMSSTTRLLFKA